MDQYIDDLLAAKGLPEDLDPEVRQQLGRDLTERATALLNRRLIDALSPADQAELEKMMDSEATTAEALQQFIADHVVDVSAVTSQALLEFRDIYLGA